MERIMPFIKLKLPDGYLVEGGDITMNTQHIVYITPDTVTGGTDIYIAVSDGSKGLVRKAVADDYATVSHKIASVHKA